MIKSTTGWGQKCSLTHVPTRYGDDDCQGHQTVALSVIYVTLMYGGSGSVTWEPLSRQEEVDLFHKLSLWSCPSGVTSGIVAQPWTWVPSYFTFTSGPDALSTMAKVEGGTAGCRDLGDSCFTKQRAGLIHQQYLPAGTPQAAFLP